MTVMRLTVARLTSATCSLALVALGGLLGCTPDHVMVTAPVSGTVTCGGKPVTEGYLIFTPIVVSGADPMNSGKTGSAWIQPDGMYTVKTYEDGDGALIGEHEVRIYKLDPEDDEQVVLDPFACGDRTIKVTVVEGDNIIDLDPAKQ